MIGNTAESLSHRIKSKIADTGMSVHAFEKKAGLKASAIQNIIYGRSKHPTLHILEAIAQTLDCSLTELVGRSEASRYDKEYKVSKVSSSEWSLDLYVGVLRAIYSYAQETKTDLSKEKTLQFADEIYEYSLRDSKNKPNKIFTAWFIDKSLKRGT